MFYNILSDIGTLQVLNSPVLLWALRNISDTADTHRMMKIFFALICLENLGSQGRLDILSVINGGKPGSDERQESIGPCGGELISRCCLLSVVPCRQ